jgi:hypothetical protein
VVNAGARFIAQIAQIRSFAAKAAQSAPANFALDPDRETTFRPAERGRSMWFLTKCAFWLTVVLMFLPVSEEGRRAGVADVSTGEAVSVLTAALNDVRGFCSRNPEACATGAQAVQGLGYRAQSGARMLQDFINEQLAETRNLTPPPGSGRATSPAQPAAGGHDTLAPTDREPAWRTPEPPQPRQAQQRRT